MKRPLPFCYRAFLISSIYLIISAVYPAFAAGPAPKITSTVSGPTTSTRPIPITISTGGVTTELAQNQLQLTNTIVSNFKRNYGIAYNSKLPTSGNPLYIHFDKRTNRIYVADDQNDQVQVLNSNFQPLMSPIGTSGTGDGQFASPGGIATDQFGNIYITDQLNNRVEIFNSKGVFIRKFGTLGTNPGELNYPAGIDVDAGGKIYIANQRNNRIDIFDNQGIYVRSFGTEGNSLGQFKNPQDVKVDADGDIYVADPDNNRIQIFKNDGSIFKTIGATTLTHPTGISFDGLGNLIVANRSTSPIQVFKITDASLLGTFGSAVNGPDDGDFSYAVSAAADGQGNIFIADYNNQRIQKLSTTDSYTANLIPLAAGKVVVTLPVNTIKDIGQNGNSQAIYSIVYIIPGLDVTITSSTVENNSFTKTSPVPITIILNKSATTVTGTNLNVTGNATIANLKHNFSLAFKSPFGGNSTSVTGPLRVPSAVALDGKGFVYVGDADSHHINVFTEDGQYVRNFGSNGTGNGQFNRPASIAVDVSGNIYVTDQSASRIEIFDNNGVFLRSFGSLGSGNNQFNNPSGVWVDATKIYVVDQGNNCVKVFDLPSSHYLGRFGSSGAGPGQFNGPTAITVDNSGNIYVADGDNSRIQKFNSSYGYISAIGSKGSTNGQFNYPNALYTDGTDKLYVIDYKLNRLQVFTLDGTFLAKAGDGGVGLQQFSSPDGIAVGKDGSIYVADQANSRIQLLNSAEGYTANITPVDGLITITLPAGAIHDANNTGNNAATFSFTYDVTPPVKPIGLVATSLDKAAKLDWSANSSTDGVVTYQIYGGTTNNPTTLVQTVNAPATSFLQTGLTNGTTYYYRITATDTYGNISLSSDVVSVTPKANPILTWSKPADIPYGTSLSAAQLNAKANVNGRYIYSPAEGTVLTYGSNQTLSVTFIPTDNLLYNTATATVSINVIAATPLITWNTPSDITWGALLGQTQLSATSDVSGHFAYSPSLYTKLEVGDHQPLNVTFTPDDKTLYTTATKTVFINVTKVSPEINWAIPADITLGTALTTAQVNPSVTGIAGKFVYTPAIGTIMNAAGPQTLSATFIPADQAHYNTVTASVTINVIDINKITPVITWNLPADININTPLSNLPLASATVNGINVDGSFTYDPIRSTILSKAGKVVLRTIFTPAAASKYNTISASVTINVIDNRKATPVITWDQPTDVTVGTLLTTAQLNPHSDVKGTFTFNPIEGTILNTPGSQKLTAILNPDNLDHYYTATKSVTINVLSVSSSKITPNMIWAQPADVTVGTMLTVAQFNINVDAPGSLKYSPRMGTIFSTPGVQTLTATFIPDDGDKYNPVTKSYTIHVLDVSGSKLTPTITWNPADINSGSALTTAQAGGAVAAVNGTSIDGTYAYTPALGTIMNIAGRQNLSVTFTPKDQTKYNKASASRTINVINNGNDTSTNPLTPTITWNPADLTIGSALTAAQAGGAIASVNGSIINGTFAYNPALGTVMKVAGQQTLTVTFTPQDLTKYNKASASKTINVIDNNNGSTGPQTPIITWNPADITVGATLTTAQTGGAIASVNGTVVNGTYIYTPAQGTVMSIAGPQTLTVAFTPQDLTKFNKASASKTINVIDNNNGGGTTLLTPIVTWIPAPVNQGAQLTNAQLNAVASVNGITIDGTFNYIPAKGTVMSIAGPQTLSAAFTPADLTKYRTTAASATLNVISNTTGSATIPSTPVITWNPLNINFGALLGDAQLNAVASLNGTVVEGAFTYVPAKGTLMNTVGQQTLSATFTPKDLTRYNSTSATKTITVSDNSTGGGIVKSTPVINWNKPADITYGTPLGNNQLNATATINGSFTYSPVAGTVLPAGSQTLNINFTPADAAHYNTASATVNINVIKAIRSLTFNPITDKTFGDDDFNPASSSSGEGIIYISSNTAVATIINGKVHIVGAGNTTITATLPANNNYTTNPTAAQGMTVNKAYQTITFNPIPDLNKGDKYNLNLITASSGLPVTLSIVDPMIASIEVNNLNALRIGTTNLVAYQAGDANYFPANSIVQPVNVKDPNGNDIIVHQAVSPNGDGINETLYIEGIAKYPENRVTVINRNGVKIYEVFNYDNKTRYFDGKSNLTGAMVTPGTYFYLIEFMSNGQGRHLTGYFVLKYNN